MKRLTSEKYWYFISEESIYRFDILTQHYFKSTADDTKQYTPYPCSLFELLEELKNLNFEFFEDSNSTRRMSFVVNNEAVLVGSCDLYKYYIGCVEYKLVQ